MPRTDDQDFLEPLSPGGVTAPAGWQAAAAACGLRSGPGPDLALIVSEADCEAAGVFTRNRVAAAPVQVARSRLEGNPHGVRAVVANAGVANACTGDPGLAAAHRTQELAAEVTQCRRQQVLVMSTGLIGAQLDTSKVERGIKAAAAALSADGGPAAAEAILTTDTRAKTRAVRIHGEGGSCVVGGMAKGAGMIHPDMATMLALITTDAAVEVGKLQSMLVAAVGRSFNRISVDGDTSTNDTVLLLANGAAGRELAAVGADRFQVGLDWLCRQLALDIVRDGEGATKFVQLEITGAANEDDALRAARTIASSPLVKTALAGADPNWGRVLAAAGRSGADLDPTELALWVRRDGGEPLQLVQNGVAASADRQAAAAILAEEEVVLRLDLGVGSASIEFWTTDLTHEYVTINAEYHT